MKKTFFLVNGLSIEKSRLLRCESWVLVEFLIVYCFEVWLVFLFLFFELSLFEDGCYPMNFAMYIAWIDDHLVQYPFFEFLLLSFSFLFLHFLDLCWSLLGLFQQIMGMLINKKYFLNLCTQPKQII